MRVDTDTMNQIISNVFDEMLGMTTEAASPDPEFATQHRVVAAIRITGRAEQLLVVEAPTDSACLIGETMFDAEPGTLDDEEILDAVGEIVNMIGGNVKGLLEGDSTLSLPDVTEESGEAVRCVDGQSTCAFVNGLPVVVRWREMAAATA